LHIKKLQTSYQKLSSFLVPFHAEDCSAAAAALVGKKQEPPPENRLLSQLSQKYIFLWTLESPIDQIGLGKGFGSYKLVRLGWPTHNSI